MWNSRPALALVVVGLLLPACSDDPPADVVAKAASGEGVRHGRADGGAADAERPDSSPSLRERPTAEHYGEKQLDRVLAGRKAREWLAQLAGAEPGSTDAEDARAALLADGNAGAAALLATLAGNPGDGWTALRPLAQDLRDQLVPGLVQLLTSSDPAVRAAAFNELRRMGRSGGWGENDAMVARAFAADGLDGAELELLAGMGSSAKPAISALIAEVKGDPDSRVFTTITALGETASSALPAVAKFVSDRLEAPSDRQGTDDPLLAAIEALGSAGEDPTGRIAATLRGSGTSGRIGTLSTSARALVRIGDGASAASLILDGLASSDPQRRGEAAVAAADLRPVNEAVVRALVLAIDDPSGSVSSTARWSLAHIAQDDKTALLALLAFAGGSSQSATFTQGLIVYTIDWKAPPLMVVAARSADPDVRLAFTQFASAASSGWYADSMLRYLRPMADDADPRVAALARDVVRTIERARPAESTSVATTDLVARLSGWDAADRARAAAEIAASGGDPVGIVQALAAMLSDKEEWVRGNAAYGLAALGPSAARALPQLAAAFEEPVELYALRAYARAAGALGGDGLFILRDQVKRRGETAELVYGIALLPPPSFPAMLEQLNNKDADVRAAFLRGLRMHPAERDVVVARARSLLQDASPSVRVAAAGTVLAFDRTVRDALDVLARILRGELAPGDDLVWSATWELAQLGPAARPLLPEIVRVLRSPVSCSAWSNAAQAAGGCGADGAAALPSLVAGLDGRVVCTDTYCYHETPPQNAALRALSALGSAAAPAQTAIERATRSDDPEVRDLARGILSRLEEHRAVVDAR